jgi:2-oxoglutarate ferredoxin oxidoreductase subunit alpha
MTPEDNADTTLSVWLSGESGEGIVSLGELITRGCAKLGLEVFSYRTFPAEIKGGTVLYKLRVRNGLLLSPGDGVDILVALNQEGYDMYKDALGQQGILVYDSDGVEIEERPFVTCVGIPFTSIARKEIGFKLAKNIVAFGAVWTALGGPPEVGRDFVRAQFEQKGDEVVGLNLKAFEAGRGRVRDYEDPDAPEREPVGLDIEPLPRGVAMETMRLNGNEAICLGAIAAGVHLYAGYPITPASELMEILARDLPKLGGKVIQAEDEIAALGMCIGGSYSGLKTMTGTSGPGFSLMVEQINLAGMAEIPVVIVDVQRGGPSTGMPTKTSQGDLNLAAFGVHNESPRVVLAPLSIDDCFYTTIWAFNIAERYQLPVIVLSDQSLASSVASVRSLDPNAVPRWERLTDPHGVYLPGGETASLDGAPAEGGEGKGGHVFLRYEYTPTGVSPMPPPGTQGVRYTATGLEHYENGDPAYSPEVTTKMTAKRFRKLEDLMKHHAGELVAYFGEAGRADVGILAWGSTTGAIREAMERAAGEGIKAALMAPRILSPLPVAQIEEFAARVDTLIVMELNRSGQFYHMVRSETGLAPRLFHQDTGLPLEPAAAYEHIVAAYEESGVNV